MVIAESLLTPQELARVFSYDPETGCLSWRSSPHPSIKAGKRCGYLVTDGYLRVEFNGRTYGVHRIAFALSHGRWPKGGIDHINGDPQDNRIENLREATCGENSYNRRRRKDNTTGFKGVCRHSSGKYQASITAGGQVRHLGTYTDPVEAAKAYNSAAKEHHGAFALLNLIPDD